MTPVPCRDTQRNLRRGIAKDAATLLLPLLSSLFSYSFHLPANFPHKLYISTFPSTHQHMYKPEHFPSLQHVPLPQLLLFLHADRNSLSLELTSLISMALAKERVAQDTNMGTIQSFANIFGVPPLIQVSDPPCESYGFESYRKMLLEEGETSEKGCHLPSLSGLVQDANCSDFMFTASNSSSSEEAHSLVNFETRSDQWAYTNGSQLSFGQGARASHPASYSEDEYLGWIDAMDNRNECDYLNSKCAVGPSLLEDLNSYEATSGSVSMKSAKKDIQYGWLYPAGDSLQDSGLSQGCSNKRPHVGGDVQTGKKHCARETRKPRTKQVPSKDPQSIAAKRRRERISERLKILQDLVPNGSKVDLVTMLEKAISYVKFLQLQVKVLATDEFWPVQGGKAPEVAQVKKAIDAILSSHRRS